ncbi:LysE/ArgO family amino acid transporter [Oceanospirillum sediminis]|uniref:Amino acid transporter n=1 Tax=Oceanospirillum sediminis TaxID=2760088 RepID=A0A839IKZ2_9GAMM|nr:LysE/ArgO family amino acid transporter [Oceanospirillum sediminis]MBB1485875.1 amino acid transporter [Oceanospirillum sediminis]
MSFTLSSHLLALIQGLGTSAGLIMAIGAQNAFVLTQGLRRQYHWPIAGICSFFDALLVTVGVAGVGALVSESEAWLMVARLGGAAFLLWYGFQSLRSAMNTNSMGSSTHELTSLRSAILTTLAITLLNPHVYLDTVVLIGSIGGQFPADERPWFAIGAISFSFIWFFSISLGARWLAPLFKKPVAWRVLDASVCIVMWSIAASLLLAI